MLEAIARTLAYLALGEGLCRLGVLPIPAPVIGFALLYLELITRGHLSAELGALSDRLLGVLGLLFVPAGVGVIAHADLLAHEVVPVVAGLVGGTCVTLALTAFVTQRLAVNRVGRSISPADGVTDVPA